MRFSRRVPEPLNPRERRLMLTRRRQEASVERDGDLLPCICRSCGSVVGLAAIDEEVFCPACGTFAALGDLVVWSDSEMLG
jgi:hypothetical protein